MDVLIPLSSKRRDDDPELFHVCATTPSAPFSPSPYPPLPLPLPLNSLLKRHDCFAPRQVARILMFAGLALMEPDPDLIVEIQPHLFAAPDTDMRRILQLAWLVQAAALARPAAARSTLSFRRLYSPLSRSPPPFSFRRVRAASCAHTTPLSAPPSPRPFLSPSPGLAVERRCREPPPRGSPDRHAGARLRILAAGSPRRRPLPRGTWHCLSPPLPSFPPLTPPVHVYRYYLCLFYQFFLSLYLDIFFLFLQNTLSRSLHSLRVCHAPVLPSTHPTLVPRCAFSPSLRM